MTSDLPSRHCDCDAGVVSSESLFVPGARIYFACPKCAGAGDRIGAAVRAMALTDDSSREALNNPDTWERMREWREERSQADV